MKKGISKLSVCFSRKGQKGKYSIYRIKVQVPIEGFDYLQKATRFEFEGFKWHKEEAPVKIGILDEFYLAGVVLAKVV